MCNMVTKHYYDHADGMDRLDVEHDRKIDKQLENNRKPKLRSSTNLTICTANTFFCCYKSYLSKMFACEAYQHYQNKRHRTMLPPTHKFPPPPPPPQIANQQQPRLLSDISKFMQVFACMLLPDFRWAKQNHSVSVCMQTNVHLNRRKKKNGRSTKMLSAHSLPKAIRL